MAPFIHGRIIPEIESSALLRRSYRVLIDPRAVTEEAVRFLSEIATLRRYLDDIPGRPCDLVLYAPSEKGTELQSEYRLLREMGVNVLGVSSRPTLKVDEIVGSHADTDFAAIISAAVTSDADVVLACNLPEGIDTEQVGRRMRVTFGDWGRVKRECEVFVRGHDVPWAFRHPLWWSPWTPFYTMSEPPSTLLDLYQATVQVGVDADTTELIRSLSLNRHSSLCYTRDKLLFYGQQRRAARRNNLERQDFAFEAGYFLNHYYVLLWAGLDQLCWIVNGLFGFGMKSHDWRKVGVLNQTFLKTLTQKAAVLAPVFTNDKFLQWVKILRAARHFIAHRGIAMPAQMFIRPEVEPTDEELEREVDQSQEWREARRYLPPDLLRRERESLTEKARLRRYKEVPEAVMHLHLSADEKVFIHPLLNVEWDFDHFFDFANAVAQLGLQRLENTSPAAP
jgi:hypothetical protein